MKTKCKRLLSLLLVFVLLLGLMPSVYAATDVGAQLTTEPAATEVTQNKADKASDGIYETGELPDPIEGHDPLDPDNPYPYGLPCENYFPEEMLAPNPYGISLMAEGQGNIPDEMWDNAILRALEYSGYDVQKQKDKGQLYSAQYISGSLATNDPSVLSNIGYYESGACPNGDETISDSSTVTGKAPKISYFESNGMVCASWVTYFLCNYLPNIEGVDTSVIYEKVKTLGADTRYDNVYYLTTVTLWKNALDQLANTSTAGVTKYTNAGTAYANMVPGDVIVFARDGAMTHIAIYAGTYDLYSWGVSQGKYHFIIHVGNSRGPEISTVEYMGNAGAKSSEPIAWYHLDINDVVDETGFIEVYKKDPNGKNLSGAKFKAVNQDTSDTYYIGPTNASGYAKSGELPLGTYVVTETVFPTGYQASGTTSWTVKLTKDTPNNTITINAVNELITGNLTIQKATNTGQNLSGWSFGVYTDAACTKPISGSPFTTNSSGKITVSGLVPGTYYVKELSGNIDFWITDNAVKTVKVNGNSTSTVTVNNTNYGYGKIIKQTNTGDNLSGWKFNIYVDSACTQPIDGSPFTTDEDGLIVKDLLPGTYYVQEVEESDVNPDWMYDTVLRTVTVEAGQTGSVTFENQQMGLVKLIKSMPDGGSVAGWVFDIYRKDDNTHIGTYTSGEDGTILSDYLLPGEYLVYEQLDEDSLYWCESENPQTVTIAAGETAEVTFTNRLKPGKIAIHKVDITGEPLTGAEFLLEWSVDGTSWQPVSYTDSQAVTEGTCTSGGLIEGKLVSDETGLVEFTGLHPERLYRLTETAAPEGYQLLTGAAYEGRLPADKDLTIALTVVNVRIFELPETGSLSMMLLPIAMTVCYLLSGACIMALKRKATPKE